MAAASTKVLGIAELLVMILLGLSMRDILLLQRVSVFWKQTIANSPKLQQALFFRAAGGLARPLSKQMIASLVELKRSDHSDTRRRSIYRNPLLQPLLAALYSHGAGIDQSGNLRLYSYGELQRYSSWKFPTASWKSMLLTQPPSEEVPVQVVMWRTSDWSSEYNSERVIKHKDGVTAGYLMDEVKQHRDDKITEWRSCTTLDCTAVHTSYSLQDFVLWKHSRYPLDASAVVQMKWS